MAKFNLKQWFNKFKGESLDVEEYLMDNGFTTMVIGGTTEAVHFYKNNFIVSLRYRESNKGEGIRLEGAEGMILDLSFIPKSKLVFDYLLRQGMEENSN